MVAFEGVGKATEYVPLHETLFNPYPLFEFGKMDEFIRGSASDNPRPVHTSFSSEVLNLICLP
jgi:apolipoprotein N-acyltransferase